MIGFALQRGLDNRLDRRAAATARLSSAPGLRLTRERPRPGSFIDVCESTARMTSLQQYLQRAAILGDDARGGAMAMLFATERMGSRRASFRRD